MPAEESNDGSTTINASINEHARGDIHFDNSSFVFEEGNADDSVIGVTLAGG